MNVETAVLDGQENVINFDQGNSGSNGMGGDCGLNLRWAK